MNRRNVAMTVGVSLLTSVLAYLSVWPVPVEPVAWTAPPNPGLTGSFAVNERLASVERLPIGAHHGPEDVAVDDVGRIYVATHEGDIVRLDASGRNPTNWARTGGRPLGLDFDAEGNLIVADAYRGLLSVSPRATVSVLTDTAGGVPIRFADDVDVARDGRIFFSDASTKFGAKDRGGPYIASRLDILEHGDHGRLLMHDPKTGTTSVVLDGVQFANGVAVSPDQTYVLLSETGAYRIRRIWIAGPRRGQVETLIDDLPGFPDNISTGQDGRFWLALVSPRNALLDRLSNFPALRAAAQRLPEFLRPEAEPYGHIVALDAHGRVLRDLQDPRGAYPLTTAVTETDTHLYVGSLSAPVLGRLSKRRAEP